MKVKIKLKNKTELPRYQTPGSAGVDLSTDSFFSLYPGESCLVSTGVAVEIPEGHVGLIMIRSSLGARGLSLSNGVGVIDSDYRGELKLALRNNSSHLFSRPAGDRIAQLLILPIIQVDFEVVDSFEETSRGPGGFGSTGK